MIIGRPGKRKIYLLLAVAALSVGATTERTVYTSISNKELKPRVMRLVKDIRELVYAHKKQDDELLATVDKRDRADATKEERKRLRDEWVRESTATHEIRPRSNAGGRCSCRL